MIRNKKFILLLSLAVVVGYLLLALTSASLAANDLVLKDPLGNRDIPELIGDVIKAILGLVGVLALVMFIFGGIMWMTSAGSAEKIKKGKDTIVWAILGLAFIFFSYAILDFILRALMGE